MAQWRKNMYMLFIWAFVMFLNKNAALNEGVVTFCTLLHMLTVLSVLPESCCCPSRLQWCSRWHPRPRQWVHWTGHFLRRLSQTSAPAPPQEWKPDPTKTTASSLTCAWLPKLWTVNVCSFYGEKENKYIMSHTFTEWLWKSVMMISLFLLTAAKCGPSGEEIQSKYQTFHWHF